VAPARANRRASPRWGGVSPPGSGGRASRLPHTYTQRGASGLTAPQPLTCPRGGTYGRPRGKTIETGESWSTQVPPIVSLPHPGITQTESICVDPIVALTGRSRFRDHGLTGLGVIESGIA